ncbi:ATP-binding protein [Maritimibacter alkaliphilus]|uniref:hybrid sensor histidine kinase/response regulator n=1 Tax=Maritimibacter alkaliphilus TaxID=404236 RepID=UPI001C9674DE|nr:ATP-binding protein [Maritimibacter alkaliphilus]MBY6089400.1 response regulator [Maritimibacter alkaliphilus]
MVDPVIPPTPEEALAARRRRSRARAGLALGTLVICVALVMGMALFVLREIEALSSANSDNLQWSLSQTDVEFLRFRLAVEHAQMEPEALDQVRRRFDIFYSRVTSLERGDVYRALRADPAYVAPRQRIAGFLDDTVPLIDGPDAALQAALPGLAERATTISGEVRALSLAGLSAYAELSDARREGVMRTLIALAAVLGCLFAGLVLIAWVLWRLSRIAEFRALELSRAGERTRTIVETSPEAIVVSDAAGNIREFNPRAQAMFGYSRAAARHRNAINLIFPGDDAARMRTGLLAFLESGGAPGEGASHFEATATDAAGRRFPAELSIARAEAGPLYIIYVRDISRRKQAEEGLTDARDRALAGERAKAEFLAVMSHEMRTPLNGMLGTMQLLRDHSLTERQSDLLDRMDSSGHLLLGLVNDVLELSKFEAGKMTAERKPFDVARLLDGVIETAAPLASAAGNSLGWSWAGPARAVATGDARRLRQVLLNLVGNAVKFTRGGSVDVEVEVLKGGEMLEVRVIDSGIGIAPENIERIFHDFETLDSSYARQAGGTGLGLGIARRLTKLMGGEIGVESEPGEGSLFWLRIPVGAEATLPEAEAAEPAAPALRPLDLLLVEDNEINRFVARQMLEAEGHAVTEAVNGRAGVEWAESRAFDAILMDISMPVMDGPEAARRIRAGRGASADRPIIAVTAHALPEEIASFRAAGIDYCIAKPIDRAELLRTLAAAVDEGAVRPTAPAAPRAQGLLDRAQIGTLWDGLPEARRDEMLARVVAEIDTTIDALVVTAPDDPALAATVHQCAGNCAAFGLGALRAALAAIETRAKQGQPVQPEALTALGPLWAETRAELEHWRAAA